MQSQNPLRTLIILILITLNNFLNINFQFQKWYQTLLRRVHFRLFRIIFQMFLFPIFKMLITLHLLSKILQFLLIQRFFRQRSRNHSFYRQRRQNLHRLLQIISSSFFIIFSLNIYVFLFFFIQILHIILKWQ